jgi:catechol 2,3-dioxygenase-like lactoylglutathione lyase family enzyme
MTKYLHTMICVSSLEDSIAFFEVLGLREIRRRPDEKGRYTNVFLADPATKRLPSNSPITGIPSHIRAAAFWPSRLRRGQHLRHLQRLHRARSHDQPPPRVTAAWPSSARRTASPSNCYRPVPRCRLPNPGPA